MRIQDAIATLLERTDLGPEAVESVFDAIMRGEATPAQIGGLLIGLRAKGETVGEIVGAARAMRAHAVALPAKTPDLVDTCGTGGDGSGTFNVSTAAALIAAGAGVPIAKHGNRAMSGKVGGADVLERLGVRIDLEPARVAACIDTVGIGFLFAQKFHPAMRHAAGPRRELGVRTVFNLLGPLCNPAGARRQVIGTFAPEWLPVLASALRELGSEHVLAVHGAGGLDEISLCGPTRVVELVRGKIREFEIQPEDLGMPRCALEDLQVEDGDASASAIHAILAGRTGPMADVAVVNAAAAIYVGGRASSIAAAVAVARASIAEGAAARKLLAWVEASR